jgi:uncharacterized protein YjiS (DUF1127 family)
VDEVFVLGLVGAVIVRAVMRVLAWHERARQRQLLLMSDHALRDIGKSRDDIASSLPRALWTMGESDQPSWRATIMDGRVQRRNIHATRR